MDTLSHSLWGYAVLRWRGKKAARWGALMGAGPDIVYSGSHLIGRIYQQGFAEAFQLKRAPSGSWRRGGPPLPQEYIDAYYDYYVWTHSLVILAIVALAWFAWKRKPPWLLLPWAFHILLDVPTHERYLTPLFWPVSTWTYAGVSWGTPTIFFGNWIALAFTFTAIYLARRKKVIGP